MKKFYVTTPIYYPSGEAHLGHCYSTVAADAIARFNRMRGHDVMFLTGTDEHGQKIETNAIKEGMKPKEYVDKIVEKFLNLWKILGISYDKFIRTTDDYHVRSVQKVFKILYDKGEIYKGKYEGWYCVPCESFFSHTRLVSGKCPDCGRDVKFQSEEAYFFKLSKYSERILQFYRNNPDFIEPESRKNEMIKFVESGLEDLCVSRTSFKWGVPVDFDPDHVVYVWIDALTNYITALGFGSENLVSFDKFWPADVHIVGKEIVRFHAIIWPAILMALDLPLPKKIYGHGWLLFGDGNKMSKSRGNVVDPVVLCKRYGTDAVRYFLLREIPFGADGTFSNLSLIERINFDLANDLGNLLSRTVSLAIKGFGGSDADCREINLAGEYESSQEDERLIQKAISLCKLYENDFENFEFSSALSKVWSLISDCNKYLDNAAPWKYMTDENEKAKFSNVLYNVFESLRIISILISPVMPETAIKIQEQIGAKSEICTWQNASNWGLLAFNSKIKKMEAIFLRIDCEKELDDLESVTQKNDNMDFISIKDFSKIDLRVGRVVGCEVVKNSKKILKLTIFDGECDREVVSGIAQRYTPEELIGRNVILVANLKPAKLCGINSNGMILASSGKNVNLIFTDLSEPGERIS
ncbi:MAG: methionine--tRNA ligase [Oscillospiraceae bacterium]|jgi:methionyl-tRNA synthetase|nr:methionine--tRNA ligase [Oscillospiraceae bacterium]